MCMKETIKGKKGQLEKMPNPIYCKCLHCTISGSSWAQVGKGKLIVFRANKLFVYLLTVLFERPITGLDARHFYDGMFVCMKILYDAHK